MPFLPLALAARAEDLEPKWRAERRCDAMILVMIIIILVIIV